MKFAIQRNLISEEQLNRTMNGLGKDGIPYTLVDVVPFSKEIISVHGEADLFQTDYIPYGSTLLTNLALERGWEGLHFDLSKFNYVESCKNRDDMLNDEYVVSVKDAVQFLLNEPKVSEWFIRPSLDLKQFSGVVMESNQIIDWFTDAMTVPEDSGTYYLDPSTMVVLSGVKQIQAEWRWFIVGGRIVDGSMYRCRGQLRKLHEIDSVVIEEAQGFANEWLPDPCCVMDLALVKNKLYVIEFNCINSSGFYDSDSEKIFRELYEYHKITT